jgi:hypothetical protein
VELLFGAVRSSEAKAVETEYPLEMGEEHLDFLPGIARRDIGVGLGDLPRLLARVLMP